ncbi:phBC6A51 family helix-turn-helix protein [Bacillus sp. MRMR6]|uniref:phBC6A51 family helix-turn-helix protein n=1 Tax=Bacillus sp. MRMR6 TaxID=1928617 RepID=UPI000952F738|nr:phBC6A51 family helix-turn-helix protein [Bacillus sp. MRMR6]OLS39085.1 hypothetical protein BTR25_13180 [Bacillus sp. MRMR6]
MTNPRFKFDERLLKDRQRLAALLLVENAFAPKKERKKKEKIAEEVGVTRMQLHRWDTEDTNFIAYKNFLASRVVDSKLPLVYAKLIESIENGSIKGIELFLKRMGELSDKHEVTINDTRDNQTFEERRAALLQRLGEKRSFMKGYVTREAIEATLHNWLIKTKPIDESGVGYDNPIRDDGVSGRRINKMMIAEAMKSIPDKNINYCLAARFIHDQPVRKITTHLGISRPTFYKLCENGYHAMTRMTLCEGF